jgi:hypothetical protein
MGQNGGNTQARPDVKPAAKKHWETPIVDVLAAHEAEAGVSGTGADLYGTS